MMKFITKTMNSKFFSCRHYIIIGLLIGFGSCKTSSEFSGSFQKRKYTKGYHLDLKQPFRKKHTKHFVEQVDLMEMKDIEPGVFQSRINLQPLAMKPDNGEFLVSVQAIDLQLANMHKESAIHSRVPSTPVFTELQKQIEQDKGQEKLYHVPAEESKDGLNTLALLSFIMAIIGLLIAPIFVAAIILGVGSIVMAVVALNQFSDYPEMTGRGFAIAGLILGVLAVLAGIAFAAVFAMFL